MSRINEGDLSLRSQIIAQGEINGYCLLSACIPHFSHILLNLSFLIESFACNQGEATDLSSYLKQLKIWVQ